jgi:hypothetical protein
MADPDVKKFFGPQMSNADVAFMMSGGTTLNPELQGPEEFYAELVRIQQTIKKAKEVTAIGLGLSPSATDIIHGTSFNNMIQTAAGVINTNW